MEPRLTGINLNEALIYLGCKGGKLSGQGLEELKCCEEQLLKAARPRAVWRRFSLLPDGTLSGTGFCPLGEDVKALLADCREVILMAATLGAEIEALIRRAQVQNMGRAMMLDACASAAIENVCDNLCEDLGRQVSPLYLTDRFSPGYGDFPLSTQADFSSLLDMQRRIGVSLSPGGLMIPQKTVTALIGLSDRPQATRPRGCAVCDLFENCAFRKDGLHCGKN